MDEFQRRLIEKLSNDVSNDTFWDVVPSDENEGDDHIQVSDHETDIEQSGCSDGDDDNPHDIIVVPDENSYHESDDDLFYCYTIHSLPKYIITKLVKYEQIIKALNEFQRFRQSGRCSFCDRNKD